MRVKVFLTNMITKDGYCAEPEATFRLKLLKDVKDILACYED